MQRVIARIDSFDPRRSALRTWLYEQSKYAVIDYRRRQRRVVPPADLEVEHEGESAGGGGGLEEVLAEALTTSEKGAMQRAFRRLRPAQRELLWWRYVEGWTPTEIARDRLEGGIPAAHVKVYISRAVVKLAALYQDETRRA